jgi:hypothetical protein
MANPLVDLTDEQLDALIAQKQAATPGGAAPVDPIVPEKGTLAEMKGLTKAGGTGLIKGAASIVGLPGDIQNLGTAALNKWLPEGSNVESVINTLKKSGALGIGLPNTQDVQTGVEKVTGPLYEPQTGAEKVMQAGGEAVPFGMLGGGPVLSKMLPNMGRAALSGGASEAAGQATEGTPYETPARIVAGMAAYGAGAATPPTTRIIANTPVRAAARALENEGVRVPASAISGSRLQSTLEGGPTDIKAAGGPTLLRQSGIVRPPGNTDQFSRLQEQRARDVGNQANQLGVQTSIPAPAVPPLRAQLANVAAQHIGQFGGQSIENPAVARALADFDQATMGGQPLSGQQYERYHRTWGADPDTRPMAQHLDAAMDRAHPGAWDDWRTNHANLVGARASADPMGGAATVSPLNPDKIVDAMYRRTPMRDTAENLQTVHAAQPKPYDFTQALTALGAAGGLGAGAAYHGGLVGASDLGIYGTLIAPTVAALAKGAAAPVFSSPGGQRFLRNLDPKVVAGLLAQQGITPKIAPSGGTTQ